ncbi:interleukin-2 receptor subunit beta [Colossoma macropomum]|uniref:interleukin-2 receptor subunit beta n=1 Tax=Colossoma macropomum TaxID=42526 RepID=UPI00186469E4|nr:interleukin-2 receptor subunit beta [Colossoma macropomum]
MKGNLLPFYTMKRKMLMGLTLLLTTMSLLASSLQDQSLTCYTDSIDIITCEWNSSEFRPHTKPETKCLLHGVCNNYMYDVLSKSDLLPIESSQPELLKATLKFEDECLKWNRRLIPVDVRCGGVKNAGMNFNLRMNVKLHPPEKLQVDHANVTWKLGSPHPQFVTAQRFEIQYKELKQSWKEVKPLGVHGISCMLPEDQLILGRQYEVRVRSKPEMISEFWSDWSPSTQWTSKVGKPPPDHSDMMPWWFPSLTGTAVVITVALILLLFFRFHPSLKSSGIHNPFEPLYLTHGGNFKSWLGTTVTPESFFKAEPECISPMVICKIPDVSIPCKKEEDKRKSFTNSTYFLSQSSKCNVMDPLEPCSEQCPYGPAGGGSVEEKATTATEESHNSDTENEGSISDQLSSMSEQLETSSSYKHLQKLRLDVQSPDSGFAAGSDQDSQEESGSEGLPSPPVVDIPSLIGVLPCPIPQASHVAGFPHLMFLPSTGLGWSPQNTNLFKKPPSVISTNTLMCNVDIMDCSGMLEPADADYMPVKKVQE